MHVRYMYNVETDGSDWPLYGVGDYGESRPLPDECKRALEEHVLSVLSDCRPLLTHELYQRVRNRAKGDERCAPFNKAALLDWLYACVVRAARAADCEERWHPPAKPSFDTLHAVATADLNKRRKRR